MRVKNEIDDDEKGKLFVGGLSWETTQEALQRYFGRYGEVIDCVVMKNSESGRSRGFGFVTFSDPANVSHVLSNGPHQLDGRTIDPKPCNPRTLQKPKRASSYPKVFLGGLPSNVTETDLRSFFTRFGKVQEVVIMYDQEKKKSRGFGFLSFEDDDAVERCVNEHFVNLNGKQVEIKKAEPRDSSNKMGDNSWGPPQGGPQMGMGGGGMGMGGPNGQMGGPMSGPMGPMGPGNMMQSYQGWSNTQAQGYPGQWGPTSNQPPVNAGYGTPSGPAGYQGWGAPAGPQGQGMAPQWGSNYGGPPQQGSYGSYGPQGTPQSGYGQNWNWNMPQNGPPAGGAPQGPSGAPGPQADMYSRGTGAGAATPSGPGPAAPGAGGAQKAGADYASYGYGGSGYGADSTSYGANRGYGADAGSNSSGGGYGSSHPPVPANSRKCSPNIRVLVTSQGDGQGATAGYTAGPGPQRGGNYTAPTQSQSFHPYRRM